MADSAPSYIDYDAFLDPTFSPVSFANTLVRTTNNPSDSPLDLSTPLSRVLFDIQEIDSHIHSLGTAAAVPLLSATAARAAASDRILHHVAHHVAALTATYRRLEAEVLHRHAAAADVHAAAARLAQTVKIGRAVARALLLARQLEAHMADFLPAAATPSAARKEDYRAMVRAASSLHSLRQLLAAAGDEPLARVAVIATLQTELLAPTEQRLLGRAQQAVREFSTSSLAPAAAGSATYAQTEATKARTMAACLALCFLAPTIPSASFHPAPLLAALQAYLHAALTASVAAVGRALAALPTLPRALQEVAARCQNIVALEALLAGMKPPAALLPAAAVAESIDASAPATSLLQPLLATLDTASLPSFFWRSLASGLAGRVQDIVGRGGPAARALRAQREGVRERVRECVLRGCQGAEGGAAGGWEREVGVMVGSVLGPLGR
ncbi:hypothetical protein MMC26_002110 [Xylographa opegraphella]|nr:hypothetical protein [Xylographa opegraphella]